MKSAPLLVLLAGCAAGHHASPLGYPFVDEVHTSGVLTHLEVLRGLAHHVDQIRECRGAFGRFVAKAEFTVVDGEVAQVHAEGFPTQEGDRCLEALVRAAAFSRRPGGTEVKWILEFGLWAPRQHLTAAERHAAPPVISEPRPFEL